jgi:hypothetical protein
MMIAVGIVVFLLSVFLLRQKQASLRRGAAQPVRVRA